MNDATEPQTILVVDDTPENLRVVSAVLKDAFKVRIATQGEQALRMLEVEPRQTDLILLDVNMPGLDGYEVCRRLKANPTTRDIPVIFLTARVEVENEIRGFEAGAVDYITKPISPPTLLARVRTHLAMKEWHDFLAHKNTYLETEVQARTRQVQRIQDVTILAMASLAETRDNETGNHILRTQRYVKALACELQQHDAFRHALSDDVVELLYKSAPLHDIGKVGIPDHILLKPGKLTPDEFEIMKTHTTLGLQAIERAESHTDGDLDFLRYAKEIAHSHQEKWDGSGYPQGLAGVDIPLSARLMAVADVYDALISARVYKPAFSHDEAVRLITEGRARHFDPDIVDAFVRIANEFARIAQTFSDNHAPS